MTNLDRLSKLIFNAVKEDKNTLVLNKKWRPYLGLAVDKYYHQSYNKYSESEAIVVVNKNGIEYKMKVIYNNKVEDVDTIEYHDYSKFNIEIE